MKTIKMKLFAGLLVLPLLLPQISLAYFTTDQTATKITDSTVLFTVTYRFGLEKRDLFMPILALRNLDTNAAEFAAGYTLQDGNKKTDIGTTAAIVLTDSSNVTVKDNQYFVPAGKSAEFSLTAIVNVSKQDQIDSDLSLIVSHLPFTMVNDGQSFSNHLNPSELQYYLTPSVTLGN